jgi:aerobic-type carbon monoxide dehydrogenase small subunit (CoxS/CutS family)
VSEPRSISITVNGTTYERTVEPRVHLADFLRHELGLTGTHVGCEQGVCGMCTVVVDGQAVKSCLMLAVQADGQDVRTVESLANGRLHPLQRAFKEQHGLQCGFCTPGFLMTATALAERERPASRTELREELSGVLCRCTGYEGVFRAVEQYFAEHPAEHPADKEEA